MQSEYVFFPMCRSSFGLNLMRAPFFLGGIETVLTGQNLGFWPFFRPPGSRILIEGDPSCSFDPRSPYSSAHRDEELALPHQPADPGKVVFHESGDVAVSITAKNGSSPAFLVE